MKKHLLWISSLALISYQCQKADLIQDITTHSPEAHILSSENSVEGKYVIKLRDQYKSTLKINAIENIGGKDLVKKAVSKIFSELEIGQPEISHYYSNVYPGFSAALSENVANQLLQHPAVEIISQDEIISLNDIDEGGSAPRKAQNTPWGVQRTGKADGSGKTVWILDTGVDLDHPDLTVDQIRSQSFSTTDGTLLSNGGDDNHGHGTHVAGTVAALDNNFGVVGVAYGATVVSVKVLGGNGSGLLSDVIAGIDYTAGLSLPGDVANMSLSGGANSLLDWAVQSASLTGTWYVMAAGNSRRHANLHSPARANGPFLITVSASRSGDYWAGFSNYGNPPVDFAAPGQSVYSTYKNKGYRTMSGTSMAAPHVAGIVLIKNGLPSSSSNVQGDPDGNPDPIAEI
ncbi:S8 family serine peptidase [Luteibaculum oceani]|uniref:S8 family serine peptidase n=1 Tax=Luteibaculum oceani TaxID=1294296 RepID=A0A5C6VJW8_9FLAO|nr:S8 family serine peptidase [Luteibaculum oceani]TXC85310.1 S8 family serine peptidase [Luteibaculum oceani]